MQNHLVPTITINDIVPLAESWFDGERTTRNALDMLAMVLDVAAQEDTTLERTMANLEDAMSESGVPYELFDVVREMVYQAAHNALNAARK